MRPRANPSRHPGKPEEQSFPSAPQPQLGCTPVLEYPLVPAQLQSPGGTRGPGAGPAHGQARWAAGGETKAPRGPGGDLENNAGPSSCTALRRGCHNPRMGLELSPAWGAVLGGGCVPKPGWSVCHPSPPSLARHVPRGVPDSSCPRPLSRVPWVTPMAVGSL